LKENGMSKQEDRAGKIAQWLAHLQGWRDSGQSLCAYARGHSLAVWAIYHWRSVLIREGRWHEPPSGSPRRRVVPLPFARVAVTDASGLSAVIVRVVLGNGRRAEIELSELGQLGKILSALEERA
jgi:hypothetical protein